MNLKRREHDLFTPLFFSHQCFVLRIAGGKVTFAEKPSTTNLANGRHLFAPSFDNEKVNTPDARRLSRGFFFRQRMSEGGS